MMHICSMRKSSHLSLIFFSKLYSMTARKPPMSSIKIQPLPFEGVFKAEEKHIVLQNNQLVSIKEDTVSCELPVTTSQVITGLPVNCELPVTTSQVITGLPVNCELPVTTSQVITGLPVNCELPVTTSQVITGLPVNCELPVTTSQVITGLPESAQVNTHLVSHASTSEQLMKLESRLTTHCIKDKVQIEQNSSAEILISFHNYNELDQNRCPPVSDITDVHNPCNVQSPVDKERKTSKQTIGNLQMSKHNSLLSNWQGKTKDKLVLTRDLLEKVTKVIRMVYINNETLIINQTIQTDDSECNKCNTGTENEGSSKKSITLPAKTKRKFKKSSTTTPKPQKESKESKVTKKKMRETKSENSTYFLQPTSVVKPNEQNDKNKTRNRRTRVKVKTDSLQTEKGNQTLEQMKVRPVDRQNDVRSDKPSTRKHSDSTRRMKTQLDRKTMTMNSCDQSSVKVTPSSSNGQNTISEGEYNTEIKRKYHTGVRVTRKEEQTSNVNKAEGISESKNIKHKIKSERKNKNKRDKDRESADSFITNISTDVLLEAPSKEELALYDLSEMFTGMLEKKYEKWKKRENRQQRKDKVKSSDDKRERRKAPNYFVAIQITNQEIKKGITDVQNCMCEVNEDLRPAMIKPSTLHLTLRVACLENQQHISLMIKALDESVNRFKKENEEMILMDVNEMGDFKNEVVFAKLQQDECYSKIVRLSEILEECCNCYDVPPTDRTGLNPHITIAKLSKVPFEIKKKVKKIQPSSYAEFQNHPFGKQLVTCLQLCSMFKRKDKTGYYQVEHVSPIHFSRTFCTFSEDKYTVYDVAHVVVTTAIAEAIQTLEETSSVETEESKIN